MLSYSPIVPLFLLCVIQRLNIRLHHCEVRYNVSEVRYIWLIDAMLRSATAHTIAIAPAGSLVFSDLSPLQSLPTCLSKSGVIMEKSSTSSTGNLWKDRSNPVPRSSTGIALWEVREEKGRNGTGSIDCEARVSDAR